MTHPPHQVSQPTRLQPRNGVLYGVRWFKAGRGDVNHRYFRRLADAEAYATKLRGYGKRVRIFQSATAWSPLDGAR